MRDQCQLPSAGAGSVEMERKPLVEVHRLIEGESLADFNAGLGDVTVKITV
ncbi:MAG: hypothetical protein L0228_11925 [Planctomycetes bacterium]|nr:hypothetical protein [Planctomycetota bacterium]